MLHNEHMQALMDALIRATEVSLAAGEAAGALVAEILKGGAETRVFLEDGDPGSSLTLTPEDLEFLSALSIRPENR